MEKSKYMNIGRKLEVINNKNKVEGLWDYVENSTTSNNHGTEVGVTGVYPWPPRSYTCSFCKRQFRSAQALGGHMNIHRRDRARLRSQYSPPPIDASTTSTINGDHHFSFLNLNLEPNPNFNFNKNPNIVPPLPPHFTSKLPTLFASSTPSTSISEIRTWGKKGISQVSNINPSDHNKDLNFGKISTTKRLLELQELSDDHNVFQKDGGSNVLKRAEFVRLELEIGLLGEEDEDLDLELRLGYV